MCVLPHPNDLAGTNIATPQPQFLPSDLVNRVMIDYSKYSKTVNHSSSSRTSTSLKHPVKIRKVGHLYGITLEQRSRCNQELAHRLKQDMLCLPYRRFRLRVSIIRWYEMGWQRGIKVRDLAHEREEAFLFCLPIHLITPLQSAARIVHDRRGLTCGPRRMRKLGSLLRSGVYSFKRCGKLSTSPFEAILISKYSANISRRARSVSAIR